METGNGKEWRAGKLELSELLITEIIKFKSMQVKEVEVEFLDKPEVGPLTVTHLMSLLFAHGLFLTIAMLVWLGELCGFHHGNMPTHSWIW